MSSNQFIPDPEEQAEEILEMLREHGADVPDDIVKPAGLVEFIDPEKPVSLNFRTVGIAIGAIRPD